VLLVIVCMFGCTTLQPIAGNSPNLQQRIASGELLIVGDRVAILTHDGTTHKFEVTSLTADTVSGPHESIPINQVVSVQRREADAGKTALAVAGPRSH
jgi:hypothetical protein